MKKIILLDSSVLVSLLQPDWRGSVSLLRLDEIKENPKYKITSCDAVTSELEDKFQSALNFYSKYIEEVYSLNSKIAKLARVYINEVDDRCGISFPRTDAIIVATATIEKIPLVLTWNFEHLDNVEISSLIREINEEKELKMPLITNPKDFIP